ncbi:hypothetical protein N7532_011901 [Penicillium argentinense]|uniref:Ran-interacting protein Mog1 n=1 Tax=Penicillium argentinense TaxID=1131581 RepID=A0A9W9JV99_9EURO|nr:uncharacterized protein N7532_011901 [Penicillium argentinense]KAJ5082858.1 hypothetical protein N7532_011901 [Penicillium argentinense]
MAQTTAQDFFGGAIRGVVPQRWIDASNLREIPDHQELFLSPETLSNLIIEINQRVSQEDALSAFTTLSQQNPSLAAANGADSSEAIDQAAALYHMQDLCDEGDSMQIITPPQQMSLARLTASAPAGTLVSAYKGVVQFKTAPKQRGGQAPATNATAAASPGGAGAPMSQLTCHYLLVRLEAQESDLLVFFNVPHEEFEKNGDAQGLEREKAIAEETVAAFVDGLEIQDWGLFL